MKKNFLMLGMLIVAAFTANAQKSVTDNYQDFTVYRTTKGNEVSIKKISILLSQKADLTVKQIANAEYHLGRMYEEVGNPDSALIHYTESIKGEPNYSVVHRAMGFIYLNKTKAFVKQMNEASAAKNVIANANAFDQYKAVVQKALPHLEKYQACEPDEQTLTIISNLYKSIKEQQAIITLPDRLKPLSQTCISLLEDE